MYSQKLANRSTLDRPICATSCRRVAQICIVSRQTSRPVRSGCTPLQSPKRNTSTGVPKWEYRGKNHYSELWQRMAETETSSSPNTPQLNIFHARYNREPLFATPCCNTSRATWPTPSESSHKKPFFEVLSFSALFDPGCCCQLVCFELNSIIQFGVLHFRLPLDTRNGQVGEHVPLLWFLALVWLAAVVNVFV